MKTLTSTLMGVALLGLSLTSCQKELQDQPTPQAQSTDLRGRTPQGQVGTARIQGQLDSTQAFANTNPALNLKLVSYSFLSPLTQPEEVAAAKTRILAPESIIPVYHDAERFLKANRTPEFELQTLQESAATKAAPANNGTVADVRASLSTYLDQVVQPGQGQVALVWERNGQRFTTLCLYNEKGLVYDNLLANLFTIQDQAPQATVGEQAKVTTSSFTATVLSFDIKWVWGGQRGHITVKHSILYSGGKITTNSGTASAWMSVGSAEARQRRYVLRSTYAQLTWAYGWATPTADFSFSYDGNPVKISASVSGVGSKGQGEGIHTIYL